MTRHPSTLLLLGAVLGACGGSHVPQAEPAPPPAVEAGRYADALEYLLDRYDADGDGGVSAQEHGRTPRAFARLDRNDDGAIDAADYASAPARGARKRGDRAALLIGQYLQADDDLSLLSVAELRQAFAAYDVDGDGRIGEEEFRCGQLSLGRTHPGLTTRQARGLLDGIDPWAGLLGGLDGDGDGWLSQAELVAFFEERGRGEPWSLAVEADGPAELAAQRPLVGRVAPDFTLGELNGGALVTLSSFVGDRPVALIFGSYT